MTLRLASLRNAKVVFTTATVLHTYLCCSRRHLSFVWRDPCRMRLLDQRLGGEISMFMLNTSRAIIASVLLVGCIASPVLWGVHSYCVNVLPLYFVQAMFIGQREVAMRLARDLDDMMPPGDET